ncbi:interleukin-12 receptor subunit beta-2 [Dendropsophus ebraccatus]|uniref:interleukin-12 receptor subunit beta-2 n=1 Tax=Dendropsophus ebraccatus TaxID=150705 RepID=UPI003831E7A6
MERRLWILWMAAFITILRPPTTEPCLAAIMTASPGVVIHQGQAINLTCTLTGNVNPCSRRHKEHMKIDRQTTLTPGTLQKDSVTVQDLPPPGETTYYCRTCKILCMISVSAGFPPDQPRSITCEQEGELGKMSCSWETGRVTFIDTNCSLQLLQKTHNVTVSSKCGSQENQSVWLPVTIAVGGIYTVLVKASNELGENVSLPYTFTYIDAVKPHPPSDITVTCDTSHDCTVTIHTDQDVQYCRIQYRITNETDWEQVEILGNRSLTLRGLRPLSQYEFQAACKYVIDRGKWSNWSSVVTHETPQDAPHGKIEAWYKLHKITSEVTIFWKYVNLSEFRGQVQFYHVILQDNEGQRIYSQNTTDTWLSRNLDAEGCVITVSAHNAMGSSPATSIRVTNHSLAGLEAPINVTATTSGPESIDLRWDLPPDITPTGEQIVTWEDPTGMDESRTTWILVSKRNRSVTITGHLKPHICYRFYVYLLWGGRAGLPGIALGSTQQTAPLTGPEFKYEVHKENAILVTWQETPAEAQMGCITHYSIYLRALSQTTRIIKIPSNQSSFYRYEIDNIMKNIAYTLEMTSTNEAGESPTSPLVSAYVQPDVSEGIPMVVVFVIFLSFIGVLFTISFAKQRVRPFIARVLPHWWSKPVPDPANCEWAKEYIENKEKREILSNVTLSTSEYGDDEEETDTLEIEEMTDEDDEESPMSVFSYKLDIATMGIHQGDNTSPKDGSTIKRVDSGVYNSREPDHPPVEYLVHHQMKPSNYLVHHQMKPSNYLVHHQMKQSNYLVHHQMKPSNYSVHHDTKPSNYLVHHDMKSIEYLVHHDINPSDLTQHKMKSSDCLSHQYIKLSNSVVHHDPQPPNDLAIHDLTPSDYLAHHKIKPIDCLLHQDDKLLNPMENHINPPAYLVHNEIKVDYLPANMLTILEAVRKEQDHLFHHQLFLPPRTNNTISLDTVQIDFPHDV